MRRPAHATHHRGITPSGDEDPPEMAVDAPAEEEPEAAEAAAKAPIADCDGDKDVGQEMEAPEAAAESPLQGPAPSEPTTETAPAAAAETAETAPAATGTPEDEAVPEASEPQAVAAEASVEAAAATPDPQEAAAPAPVEPEQKEAPPGPADNLIEDTPALFSSVPLPLDADNLQCGLIAWTVDSLLIILLLIIASG